MKKPVFSIITVMLSLLASSPAVNATDLADLKVLYVGSGRTADYMAFLKENVGHAESREYNHFNPADAAGFDVVLLDWPETTLAELRTMKTSPLGARENWNKPTVLLGSSGLYLAFVWKLKGGTGCTCLQPLAYDLRDDEVFSGPLKIDRFKTTTIPTPAAFKDEIKAPTIDIVPIVRDLNRQWKPGWCSYSSDFVRNPDTEWFCGGVNEKTPTAGAMWRQGNLFHFGFEQSPLEMNEVGQKLLLNAIAYISRFTEDRPIAVTPSVFAGPVARTRSGAGWDLEHAESEASRDFTPGLWEKVKALDPGQLQQWIAQNIKFLHPNTDLNQGLEIDEDLVALGVPFDAPDFFDKVVAALREEGPAGERAGRLLKRYAPIAPQRATADGCAAWWTENKPYLFASDSGDYCWYIDPLAKKRQVPTAELRGAKRADRPATTAQR